MRIRKVVFSTVVLVLASCAAVVIPPEEPAEQPAESPRAPAREPAREVAPVQSAAESPPAATATAPAPASAPRDASTTPAARPILEEPARSEIPLHRAPRRIHVVAAGETLAAIARRYETTVAALERANPRLRADKLVAGDRIVLPNGKKPVRAIVRTPENP